VVGLAAEAAVDQIDCVKRARLGFEDGEHGCGVVEVVVDRRKVVFADVVAFATPEVAGGAEDDARAVEAVQFAV
jgi:hypothetical protein